MPDAIAPCLATLVDAVPRGEQWLHEIKWDGYRLIAFVRRGKARLTTRNGHDWTHRFPGIAKALGSLPVETAVVDGEAVIEDDKGLSSFSALQEALSDGRAADKAIFHAFDLLYRDGVDLRGLPLAARKDQLSELVPAGGEGALRFSEHIVADGEAMMRSACQLGLEGVISKARERPYRSGRNGDWVKIKCTARQEFVVCGYTPSSALSRAVGSLVLGYHENGRLTHAGRTGTGFTATTARDVFKRLQPLRIAKPRLRRSAQRLAEAGRGLGPARIRRRGRVPRLDGGSARAPRRLQGASRRQGAERDRAREPRRCAACEAVRGEAAGCAPRIWGNGGRGRSAHASRPHPMGGERRHEAGVGGVLRTRSPRGSCRT